MIKKVENVILYHRNCSDGFGAAWAAWKKFGKKAEYIGVNHQELPPKGLGGKNVYLVDFSYPVKIIKELLKTTKSLTILDHHITAKPLMEIIPNHIYAVNNSGSVITWNYFHPKKRIPKLLRHIEDFDLWKFKLPNTHEVLAWLDRYDQDFKLWNKLAATLENPKLRKEAINQGRIILKSEEELVEQIVGHAEIVNFEGRRTLAVNSGVFVSQVGNALYKKMPPMGIVWSKRNGKLIVSLRSTKAVNVAKLAERYGGGGHKQAAGFSMKIKNNKITLPWKYPKK